MASPEFGKISSLGASGKLRYVGEIQPRAQLRYLAMYSYIVRRLAFGLVTIFVVSVLVFVILRILPGDPLVAIFGMEGFTKLSAADRASYMAQLGLERPAVAAISALDAGHRPRQFRPLVLPRRKRRRDDRCAGAR